LLFIEIFLYVIFIIKTGPHNMNSCGYFNPIVKNDIQLILSEDINWDYFSGKTVLVTGANGFIPSYIIYTLVALNVTRCLHDPVTIIALVRNKEKAEQKFASLITEKRIKLLIVDVSNPIDMVQRIDIIIHAASQASPKYYGVDPVGTLKANTLGTANMLDMAHNNGTEKFLYISSGEVYGVLDGSMPVITEEYTGNVDITNVRSCYAEGKRMGENMCVCWSYQYNFHVNMLRLSHTYGPGVELDDGRVFGDFVRNILNNEDIVLTSNGKARRSFVYITDMIVALFKVLIQGENRQAYNVATDTETEILELAEMLCNLYPEKHLSVKFSEGVTVAGYIRSASISTGLCTDKLKKLLWQQKINIRDGFYRMIESYYG
jgi:nucleoside-diphosphate-sugar epimerase